MPLLGRDIDTRGVAGGEGLTPHLGKDSGNICRSGVQVFISQTPWKLNEKNGPAHPEPVIDGRSLPGSPPRLQFNYPVPHNSQS